MRDVEDAWPPTRSLVSQCQLGDPQAQRGLYEVCRQRVYRLVYRMVGADGASDVLQQVFLQLFRNLHQYAGESRFETWMFRLAVNECLQYRRRMARKRTTPMDQEPVDDEPGHERRADNRELLATALARLEAELKDIFLLREVEHMSYAEIAETLQIPEGTVASRLNRARRQLQTILAELGWEP